MMLSAEHQDRTLQDPFSPSFVQKAIDRLPTQWSDETKRIRRAADEKSLTFLVAACDAELDRWPFDQADADMASSIQRGERETDGMLLENAVRPAFSRFRQPSDDEVRILRWMAANPGGSYAEAEEAYGKGDLGLCIGHLVYDRYGCFRRFIDDSKNRPSVLIEKDRRQGSVRHTLKPELLAGLREAGVI